MNKEQVEEIKQSYAITEEEFQKMYEEIKTITFENHEPNKDGNPTAIFTGGQPGAGKSSIILKTKQEFVKQNKDLIVFDLDIYRGFYKNSIEIAKKYPELYSEITGKASGRVMEMLSEEAIKKGYDFILEGTMGKSVYTLDVLKKYRDDYNIIARLMAVSKEESLLSIFERYIEMKKNMGIGRLTQIESHNKKYSNFTNVATTLETRGVEVEVHERSEDISNPKLIYKTSNKNNTYSSVLEAIIMGRSNSHKQCMLTAGKRLESIKKDLIQLSEQDKYIVEINKLTEIIEELVKKEGEEERD